MNIKRKVLKIAAMLAAFALTTGLPSPISNSGFLLRTYTAGAADEEKPVEGKEGDFTYQKYSDHVVITKCEKSVTSVTIPETIEGQPVTEIGMYAFQITGISSVEIPNSVKEIGHWAFSSCSNLKSVKIPDSVEKIGIRAFESCPELTDVEFPDHAIEMNSNVFDSTPWLAEQRKKDPMVIVNGVLVDAQTCKGDVVVPSDIKYIASSAFARNMDLTSVVIPAGVKKISDNMFFYCTSLTSAELKGAEFIDSMAFCNCTKLTDLKISGKLTKIDSMAFSDAAGPATITFYGSEDTWKKVDKPDNDTFLKNAKMVFDESHTEPEEPDIKDVVYGDANCDGGVSLADAVLIMQSLANPNRFGENGTDEMHITPQGSKNADCCNVGDGVTNKDALAIQKKMLNLIAELPEKD